MSDVPPEYHERLEKLKHLVQTGTNFADSWEYFIEHLGEDEGFLDVGEPISDYELLATVIAQVAKEVFKTTVVTIRNLLFIGVGENFIHGGCTVRGTLTNVMYFKDVDIGILALLHAQSRDETLYVRFSLTRIPPGRQLILPEGKAKPS